MTTLILIAGVVIGVATYHLIKAFFYWLYKREHGNG